MKIPALTILTAMLAAGGLRAQVGMGSPTAGSGGPVSGQALPTLGSGGGTISPGVPRPVYISGKVAMPDGSAVPQNVTIERVCSGVAKTVAYTDSKGRFTFQWGDRNALITDASDAGFSGRGPGTGGFGGSQSAGGTNALATDPYGSRMMNCELRASVAGYTSDTVDLFNRRQADNPDIGMIVLHRIAGVEGTSISVTAMMAPKDAKKAYEHGLQSLLKNKPDDAAKDFEKAVSIYPNYADAWVSLGKIRIEKQSAGPARDALEKAIQADPKLVTPYVELGLLSAQSGKWQESGQYLDRAVKLDPVDYPQAWYADAVANYNLKNYDAAEQSAREAVKLDPHHANPRAGYLLGLVLAEKRDYAGAAAELTEYLQLSPNAPDVSQVKGQLGQLQQLMGGAKPASAQSAAAKP